MILVTRNKVEQCVSWDINISWNIIWCGHHDLNQLVLDPSLKQKVLESNFSEA